MQNIMMTGTTTIGHGLMQESGQENIQVKEERLQREEKYRPEPIHATTMTTFIMKEKDAQNLNIERIFSTGSVTVQRFNVEGPTYMTIANRTLLLIEKKPIGQLNQIQKSFYLFV